jgi:hypothetical protein
MNTQICLNCNHWRGNRVIDPEEPLLPFMDEWREGNCHKLEHVLSMTFIAGWNGASLDTITTPASFGCAAFELMPPIDKQPTLG